MIVEWLVKLLFIVILAPFFICLFVQLVTGMLVAMLPWLIAFAAVMGLVAGVSAGLVLRRRLPHRGAFVSGDTPRVKRPRGPRDDA
jgi:hypothetical protein